MTGDVKGAPRSGHREGRDEHPKIAPLMDMEERRPHPTKITGKCEDAPGRIRSPAGKTGVTIETRFLGP
jgi:hypothetical protein